MLLGLGLWTWDFVYDARTPAPVLRRMQFRCFCIERLQVDNLIFNLFGALASPLGLDMLGLPTLAFGTFCFVVT